MAGGGGAAGLEAEFGRLHAWWRSGHGGIAGMHRRLRPLHPGASRHAALPQPSCHTTGGELTGPELRMRAMCLPTSQPMSCAGIRSGWWRRRRRQRQGGLALQGPAHQLSCAARSMARYWVASPQGERGTC